MEAASRNQVIAVTGMIGSGKSTACAILAELGAAVISADQLARQVLLPGSDGLRAVVERFGDDVLSSDGQLDRKRLGAVVFSDAQALADLESITHPRIRKLAEQEFAEKLALKAPLVVYDCPLLFEAGLDKLGFKAIILIYAEEEVCSQRIIARDGLSKEEAYARIRAQLPLEYKRDRASVVVDNNASVSELREQLKKVYSAYALTGDDRPISGPIGGPSNGPTSG